MRGDDDSVDDMMPLWLGDYWRDTGDLDCLEHGAYLQLLGRLWSAKGYLPFDPPRLAKMVNLRLEQWDGVWSTLSRFFTVTEGRLSQRRNLLERERAIELKLQKHEAGLAGANARWHGKKYPTSRKSKRALADGTALRSECAPSGSPSREKIGGREDSPSSPSRARRPRGVRVETSEFQSWYEAFPRKVARDDAWKAWQQTEATGRPDLATLLATLKWQRELDFDRRPPDKVPYPATYLRKGQWKDEKPEPPKVPPAAPPRSNGARQREADNAAAAAAWLARKGVGDARG